MRTVDEDAAVLHGGAKPAAAQTGARRPTRPGGTGRPWSLAAMVLAASARLIDRVRGGDQADVTEGLGKLPSCSPFAVSISSASRPRSFA